MELILTFRPEIITLAHQPSTNESLLEAELKFVLLDKPALLAKLQEFGAEPLPHEQHEDTYFRHPCRDFVASGEALRIRRLNRVAHITYKGPKLAGPVKIRPEMEWSLAPGDTDGALTTQLWINLGFEPVACVKKTRQPFRWTEANGTCTVTIDEVDEVGPFVEVEQVIRAADVEGAKRMLQQRGEKLGLNQIEPRSYLSLLLQRRDEVMRG